MDRWPDSTKYVTASGPLVHGNALVSPMLWTSISTGKMAYHHGVPGFTEVEPQSGAIVPVSAATRKCKTVWEMLAERGLKSHIFSWFATQGEFWSSLVYLDPVRRS